MDCVETIAAIKDVILAIAAVVGIYAAIRGLNTWDRQLKGGASYELARRLTKNLYRYRDAIAGVRHPFISASEHVYPEREAGKASNPEVTLHYGLSKAYEARWSKVTQVRSDLHTDLLESEVIWGAEVQEQFKEISKLEWELNNEISCYLESENPNVTPEMKKVWQDFLAAGRSARSASIVTGKPDPFADDLKAAINVIEAKLMPHLGRE